jgi:hypothetical protein
VSTREFVRDLFRTLEAGVESLSLLAWDAGEI